MNEDEELARIRRKKIRELMKEALRGETEGNGNMSSLLITPVELTSATFYEAVRKNSVIVVDCWAPWCAPCRVVSPIIEQLAKEYGGKVVFGKLNIDENPLIAQSFGVMSIPTLLVFKEGKPVGRIVGAMSKEMLKTRINSYL